ncbi:MAG: hypothetical protein Q4G03_10855 [Planctomycetia bacterium]|nr:hypothetical protein [Planctomycetia bacterium]
MTATIANFADNMSSTRTCQRAENFGGVSSQVSQKELTVAEATRQRDRIVREDFAALKQILAIS